MHAKSITRLVFALAILSNLVFYCSELPLIRLAERKICQEHWRLVHDVHAYVQDHRSNEECGLPVIQDQVATVIGLRSALDAIPPLLTSLWYGSLVPRFGHSSIIALACTGELLNLLWFVHVCLSDRVYDVRWAWLAALCLFIGGGQFVLYAMFSLIVVGTSEEGDRARKLAILHAITLISALIGAPISGLLLQQSEVLPVVLILVLALARYPLIFAMGHTAGFGLQHQPDVVQNPNDSYPILSTETQPLILAVAKSRSPEPSRSTYAQLRQLLQESSLRFCLLCFFLKRVAFTSEVLMFQTVAARLNKSLDHTAWVRLPIGSGASITLLLLLPKCMHYTANRLGSKIKAAIWAARLNLVILTIGFGLFWRSFDFGSLVIALALCGAGEGLAPSIQTLASMITPRDRHDHLFIAISLIDTLAKLIGGPVMAKTFSLRGADQESYGYCYLLSSILFVFLLYRSYRFVLPLFNASDST